ncbi:23664_t:CDS:2, partial [Gigaspora rosea]
MANEGLKVHPPPLADLETVNLPVHGSRGEDTQLTVAGTSGNRYKAEMLWKLLKILLACKKEQSVSFEIVDDLKEAVKKKLSLKLDDMTVDVIIRRHDEADDLRPGFVVDESLINDDETPLQPVQCQPFSWKMENDEAHQMLKVEEWFKERIKSTMQLSCDTDISIDRFDCHGKLIIGVGIAAKEAKVKLNHDIQHEKPVDITIPEEIKREIMDMFVLTDCNDTG